MSKQRLRRIFGVIITLVVFALSIYPTLKDADFTSEPVSGPAKASAVAGSPASLALNQLAVKGRAPKTGYTRQQFGNGWGEINGCSTRDVILNRDLDNVVVNNKCQVESGVLDDPYTGKTIDFKRGSGSSSDVQIDHVVAISDAWQTGAQQLSSTERTKLANDPLELLAVDGPANENKGDGDAATWLPPNKAFRCQYIARQIAVKQKYRLWVTSAEKDAMARILSTCPAQALPLLAS